ncbi:Kinesin-like protein KIF1C [Smittium culicis]|uniref:Kinesin-like protein KIF1C n=1 Tax=Smittium culicis TaxID=133412 RepID=A0A1R1YLX1_9FUNG|nr:Kinesin-like protein KIF1C [Smittium culicis]
MVSNNPRNDLNNITVSVRCRPTNISENEIQNLILSPSDNNKLLIHTKTIFKSQKRNSTSQSQFQNIQSHSIVENPEKFSNHSSKTYAFDNIFWPYGTRDPNIIYKYSQLDVYNSVAKPLLEHAFLGYNISIFAYGQSGSGKTYTMFGNLDSTQSISHNLGLNTSSNDSDNESISSNSSIFVKNQHDWGIVPRICHDLFEHLNKKTANNQVSNDPTNNSKIIQGGASNSDSSQKAYIEVSYYEIYSEKVYDLLSPSEIKKSLRVREHPALGPYIEDLTVAAVSSVNEIMDVLTAGNEKRATASTNLNSVSSRSHAVFTIKLIQKAFNEEKSSLIETVSKISLVDLAGSEKIHLTGATDLRMREGISINKSLTTLSKVTSALAASSAASSLPNSPRRLSHGANSPTLPNNHSPGNSFFESKFRSIKAKPPVHIPYRDSVLTWLLKESLGGNSRTSLIATVNPLNYNETLSTLNYAERTKKIVNVAVVNEDSTESLVNKLKQEIKLLKDQLANLANNQSIIQNVSILQNNNINLDSQAITNLNYVPGSNDFSKPTSHPSNESLNLANISITNNFINLVNVPETNQSTKIHNFSKNKIVEIPLLSEDIGKVSTLPVPNQFLKIQDQIVETEKFIKEFSLPWEQKLRRTRTLIDSRSNHRISNSDILPGPKNLLEPNYQIDPVNLQKISRAQSIKDSLLGNPINISNKNLENSGNFFGVLVESSSNLEPIETPKVYYLKRGFNIIGGVNCNIADIKLNINLNSGFDQTKHCGSVNDFAFAKIYCNGYDQIILFPIDNKINSNSSVILKINGNLVISETILKFGSRISINNSVFFNFLPNYTLNQSDIQTNSITCNSKKKELQSDGSIIISHVKNIGADDISQTNNFLENDYGYSSLNSGKSKSLQDLNTSSYKIISTNKELLGLCDLSKPYDESRNTFRSYKDQVDIDNKYSATSNLQNITGELTLLESIESASNEPSVKSKSKTNEIYDSHFYQSKFKKAVKSVILDNKIKESKNKIYRLAQEILLLTKPIKEANIFAAKFSIPVQYHLFLYKENFFPFPISHKDAGMVVNGIDTVDIFKIRLLYDSSNPDESKTSNGNDLKLGKFKWQTPRYKMPMHLKEKSVYNSAFSDTIIGSIINKKTSQIKTQSVLKNSFRRINETRKSGKVYSSSYAERLSPKNFFLYNLDFDSGFNRSKSNSTERESNLPRKNTNYSDNFESNETKANSFKSSTSKSNTNSKLCSLDINNGTSEYSSVQNINKKYNYEYINNKNCTNSLESISIDLFGKLDKNFFDFKLASLSDSFLNLEPNQSIKTGERLHEDLWLTPKAHELVIYANFLEIDDFGNWVKVPVVPIDNITGKSSSSNCINPDNFTESIKRNKNNMPQKSNKACPKYSSDSINIEQDLGDAINGVFGNKIGSHITDNLKCLDNVDRNSDGCKYNYKRDSSIQSQSYNSFPSEFSSEFLNDSKSKKFENPSKSINSVDEKNKENCIQEVFILKQGLQRMLQISVAHNSGRNLDLEIKNVFFGRKSTKFHHNNTMINHSPFDRAYFKQNCSSDEDSIDSSILKMVSNKKFVNLTDNRTFVNFVGAWESFRHFTDGQESISSKCEVKNVLITIEAGIKGKQYAIRHQSLDGSEIAHLLFNL